MTVALLQPIYCTQKVDHLPSDMDTPISLFLQNCQSKQGILLESAAVDGTWGRYSLLATDYIAVFRCHEGLLQVDSVAPQLEPLHALAGQPFMEGLRACMAALHIKAQGSQPMPPITRALYGYFGFEAAALFNPRLNRTCPDMQNQAEACLVLPATVLLFDHVYNRLCKLTLPDFPVLPACQHTGGENNVPNPTTRQEPQVGAIKVQPNQAEYEDMVLHAKQLLQQGEVIQVVPSTRSTAPFRGDAFALYRKIRQVNASPYLFFMRLPEVTLLGSSPEVMVRCTAGQLQLSPIAGTRKRGATEQEDAQLATELLEDHKERAEHVMLVDLGRNDLGRIAERDSVHVERLMEVERFSHVMHLTSRVCARLAKGKDAIDVLAATFPAGTVSGAPKIRAIEIIAQMEQRPRGPYGGCIGWLGLDKDAVHMDTGITIRSLWLREGVVHWQSGGGLVYDSDPAAEWMETYNKSAVMREIVASYNRECQGD